MKTYEFNTWQSAKLALTEISGNNEFFWRGQGESSWHLCSSLYRFYQKHDIPDADRAESERSALQAFRASYLRLTDRSPESQHMSTSDVMVRMQHFGCPTRLLDWTWSPYIAVYFAVTDMSPTGGALYGLNITEYQGTIGPKLPLDDYDHGILKSLPDRILTRFLDSKIQTPIPIHLSPYTGREFQQQSTFLVDLDIRILTEQALDALVPDHLHKILLSPSVVPDALQDLASMNVDGFHLFGGDEGCAKQARDHLLGLRAHARSIRTVEVEF